MKTLEQVPEYIHSLIPYEPGKPIEEVEREYGIANSVKLASNENPLGPSPKALSAIRERLEQLHRHGTISVATWEHLAHELDGQIQTSLDAQRELVREQPSLGAEELDDARREGLRAGRARLTTLLSDGIISEQVYGELVGEIDAALQAEPATTANEGGPDGADEV